MSREWKKDRRQRNLSLWRAAYSLNAEQRKVQTETKRRRKKHKFCLNVSSPVDRQLSEMLSELTSQSLATEYIRNGVALYSSLKDGESLDVLFSMFGWIKEVIAPQIDAMLAMSKQMQVLERMMKESGHTQIPFTKQLMQINGGDNFDTEKLRVATKKVKSSGKSVSIFLDAFGEV